MSKFVWENDNRNKVKEGVSFVDAWIANHTLHNMAPLYCHHCAHDRPVSVVGVGGFTFSQLILRALRTCVCDLQECCKDCLGFQVSNSVAKIEKTNGYLGDRRCRA